MNSTSYFPLACAALGLLAAPALSAAGFTQETSREFLSSGDFNGDGILDVIVVDRESGAVRVMQGQASGDLKYAGAMASGISNPSFASVGRIGDGTAVTPTNDRLLVGSPESNRAVVVNPRFPAAAPRPLHQLGIAPEAAAVVQLPAGKVAGATVHEDIIGRARYELSAPGPYPQYKPGAIRELLNKGSSITENLSASYGLGLRSLNAVTATKGTVAEVIVAGFASYSSEGNQMGGMPETLLLLRPGEMTKDASGFLDRGKSEYYQTLINARYVAAIFGARDTATFVLYSEGNPQILLAHVEKVVSGGVTSLAMKPAVSLSLDDGVRSLAVVRSTATGESQLAIAYITGLVEIRDVAENETTLASVVNLDPSGGDITSLVAGPKGLLHVMRGEEGSGLSSSATTVKDDGTGNWEPVSEAAALPAPSKTLDLANVLIFDKQPFLNADARMMGAYRAGDWTQRVTFGGSGSSLTATATAESFRDPVLGLGAASSIPLGSVVGPASGSPGQLANQYADNVSIFSLEQAQGDLVDVVSAEPPSGVYDGVISVALRAAGGAAIYVRSAGAYGSFMPYSGPISLGEATTLEYYAESGGRRGAIYRSGYKFSRDLKELDSDGDGLPDFVELAKGLHGTGRADSDGDGFSDLAELIAKTNPLDQTSRPDADQLLPGDSRFYLRVTPQVRQFDETTQQDLMAYVAASGSPVTAYGSSGQLLDSAAVVDGTPPAAPLQMDLPARSIPWLALGTASTLVMNPQAGPSQPIVHPEMVGLLPVPELSPVEPESIEIYPQLNNPASLEAAAEAWLEAYAAAWATAVADRTMAVDFTAKDTVALLLVEAKVTEVMRSRGMLSDGSREGLPAEAANLTPWRTRRSTRLITPSAAQWRQLEQASSTGESLLLGDCLDRVQIALDDAELTAQGEALATFVEGIYRAASQREALAALLAEATPPIELDLTAVLGSPVDILREFFNRWLAAAGGAAAPIPDWLTTLGTLDEQIASVVDAAAQAQAAVVALVGQIGSRPRTTLTLAVPDPLLHADLVGMPGVLLVDSESSGDVYRLLDAKGRDYEITKGLPLPPDAVFEVTAFTDRSSSSTSAGGLYTDLEVISVRWLAGRISDILDGPQPPTVVGLTATLDPGGDSLDTSRPLLVPDQEEVSGVSLSVGYAGNLEGLQFQWRRQGLPIEGATDAILTLSRDVANFAGFYDVVVSNDYGSAVSSSVEVRMLRIKPVIERLDVELSALAVSGRNVIAAQGESLTLSVRAQTAAPSLRYQWLRNGVALPDANGDTLSLDSIRATDMGSYSVRLTPEITGTVTASQITTSDPVDLAVFIPSGGLASPPAGNVEVRGGRVVSLAVTAVGRNLKYYWSRSSGAALDARAVTAANGNLNISNAGFADIGEYQCVLEMAGEIKRTIGVYNLNVLVPPQFLGVQPLQIPDAVVRGTVNWAVSLDRRAPSLTATGLPAGLSFDPLTGRVSGSLRAAAGTYTIKFTATNEYGSSSANATLVVRPLNNNLVGDHIGHLARHSLNGNLGGTLALNVTALGACSGSIRLGTLTLPFASEIETIDGINATVSLSLVNAARVTIGRLSLQMDAEKATMQGSLLAPLTLPAQAMAITGWKNTWNPARAGVINPYASRQNVLLRIVDEGSNGADVKLPAGYGYASVLVAPNGTYTATGRSADGETLTWSGGIGAQGQLGIFLTLYSTLQKGSINGTLQLADGREGSAVSGLWTWNRPANISATARLYPSGFTPVTLRVEGGRYTAPATGRRLLTVDDANRVELRLQNDDAGLAEVQAANLNVSTTNAFTLFNQASGFNGARVTATTGTGVLSGGINRVDNGLTRAISFGGLVVPLDGSLRGYGNFNLQALPNGAGQTLLNTRQFSGSLLLQAPPLR